MMTFLARWVLRYPGRIAVGGSLLGILSAYFAVQLYRNLRPDIEELLPSSSRSVRDLEQLTARLGSFENLVVLVFSDDVKASRRFVDDLTQALQTIPKNTISRVEYRIQQEVEFFKRRQALYLGVDDLRRVSDYVGKRILYEKTVRNPIRLFPDGDLKEPKFDFNQFKKARQNDISGFTKFKDGYYATEDEKVRAIIVYMPGKGLNRAREMKRAIVEKIDALKPTTYAPDLKVKYTGNVENLLEESAALIADLEFSTAVCFLLIFLSLYLFFRSPVATSALGLSLLMGTLWTFGLCYFLVGYLNANTAFLASIVLGNGINFGIMFLARYLEERQEGRSSDDAISIGMQRSAAATGTAALAAGLAYASLTMTSFRGFSQFGVIGLVGMVLCWVSAYTVLPAYLVLLDRWHWLYRDVDRHSTRRPLMDRVANLVDRRAGSIIAIVVVATLLSVMTFKNYGTDLIETDLSKLRDRTSMTEGSGALYHYISDIFGRSSSPLLVLAKSRQDAVEIAKRLREEKARQGDATPFTLIQTLDDFVPSEQPEKILVLKQIQEKMDPKILRFAPLKDRQNIYSILNPDVFKAFGEAELPEMVRYRFSEVDNTRGKIVLVDKKFEQDTRNLEVLVTTVRKIADSVSPGTPVAGQIAVTYDMYRAIIEDGPRVTLYALILVVLLVSLSFRNFQSTALALFALFLGMIWFMGLILGLHLRLNFLNFIAFPITFGIGVDYGVNMFQRFREGKSVNILAIVRNAGGAVVLCSLTTIIGYSSLLLAGNQAFVSFGTLAVIGEITCICAAVLALPAFLRLRQKASEGSATRRNLQNKPAGIGAGKG